MLSPEYVSGFCDGEASFSVTVSPRANSWQIRPSFSVSQNEASRDVLYKIQQFFKCGYVRPSKSDNTYKYEVRSLAELQNKITPHFKKYSLHTEKRKNFEIFVTIIQLMLEGKHLTKEGLSEIVKLLEKINPKCKKIYDRKKLQGLMNV
jgi:hypothetical protein